MPTDDRSRKRPQRVQLACIPCRQAKLKCNRDFPTCDQCFKRSRDTDCVYTERGLRYNAAKSKASSMKEKIDRLETFVNHLKEAGSKTESLSTASNGRLETIGLEEADHGLSPVTGNLRLSETGSTQYIGPTHWESIIEDIAEVKAYFDIESSPGTTSDGSPMNPASTLIPVDIHFGLSQTYTMQDLLNHMPSKADMDRAIATWFNSADPLRLILHAPTFQREYHRFWQNQDAVSVAWLAALLSVAGVGSETSGQLRRDKASLAMAEDLRHLTAHALVLADYAHPQPYIIEALIMHVKSLMIKVHECDDQIWMLCGTVTRLCIRAGYHRDPSKNPAITPLDGEMRRRVWAFVREYDILISYQSGSVSIINQQRQDTAPPTNLLDSDLTVETLPVARSLEESTPIGFAIVYGNLVSIYGDVIYSSHNLNHPSAKEISNLDERLVGSRNDLPQRFTMVPIDQSLMDTPECILDRYKLELMYLKALCILYRRYIGMPGHEKQRVRCLDAAEELIRLQIELLEASKPGGQLATFLILLQRHVHDLAIAAMLLCSELKDSTESTNKATPHGRARRTIPMLLRICELWRDIGVASAKSRHALRAIELFVQQLAYTMEKTPRDGMAGIDGHDTSLEGQSAMNPTSGTYFEHTEFTDLNSSQPGNQDLSFIDGTSFSTERFNGYDFDHDPLFRDLFGLNCAAQDPSLADWR